MWRDLDKTCGLFSVLVRHSVLSAESASVKTAAWSGSFFCAAVVYGMEKI